MSTKRSLLVTALFARGAADEVVRRCMYEAFNARDEEKTAIFTAELTRRENERAEAVRLMAEANNL